MQRSSFELQVYIPRTCECPPFGANKTTFILKAQTQIIQQGGCRFQVYISVEMMVAEVKLTGKNLEQMLLQNESSPVSTILWQMLCQLLEGLEFIVHTSKHDFLGALMVNEGRLYKTSHFFRYVPRTSCIAQTPPDTQNMFQPFFTTCRGREFRPRGAQFGDLCLLPSSRSLEYLWHLG